MSTHLHGEQPLQGGGRTPRHLWDYWRILWDGKWLLMGVLVLTTGVAVVGTLLAPKRYRASALLEIDLTPATVLGTIRERGMGKTAFERDQGFKTEFEKVKTRRLLSRTLQEHSLLERVPGLPSAEDPIEAIQAALTVERLGQTNVAKITVSWFDPDTAALLANAISDTYVDADLEQTAAIIRARVQRLSEMASRQASGRRQVVEYDLSIMESTRDLETLLGLSSASEDERLTEIWSEYRRLEREVQSKSETFGREHEEMKRARSELAEAESQLRDALGALRQRLEEELKTLGGKGERGTAKPAFVPETESSVSREVWNKILEAAAEQSVLQRLVESKATIIDPALPPRRHYSPRLVLNLALAIVVGMGFGGGLLFFREYLDVAVKTLDDVETDLGLNLLAVVPRFKGEPSPVVREAYQTLRTSLVFASDARKDNRVLVSSAAPREGKSTTAIQVARCLAEAGDTVLLMDCDMRRPSLAGLLSADPRKGISTYLAGTEGDWRAVTREVAPRLSLMATGSIPPNPLQMLGLERFRELMDEVGRHFDWVVVDSPPSSSVSDPLVLADLTDLVVIVIRQDRTDREVVRRAVARLQAVGARVAGAVVNDVDMSKAYNRDYYYGRYYYGSYYGDDATGPQGRDGKGRVRAAS